MHGSHGMKSNNSESKVIVKYLKIARNIRQSHMSNISSPAQENMIKDVKMWQSSSLWKKH
jgi:hypothetical protein